ncbi:MAG: TOBE domain-containing protein [Pseudomonadota bacterium]
MNILDAEADGRRLHFDNGIALPSPADHSGGVKVGIRPEHLSVDKNGPVELDVDFAEPLGANTLLHGRLNGSAIPIAANLPGIHRAPPGDEKIRLSVKAEQIHLFDAQSGHRLD